MNSLVSLKLGLDRALATLTADNSRLSLLAGLVALALVAVLVFALVPVEFAPFVNNPELSAGRDSLGAESAAIESAFLAENPEIGTYRHYVAPSPVRDGALEACCSWELWPRT